MMVHKNRNAIVPTWLFNKSHLLLGLPSYQFSLWIVMNCRITIHYLLQYIYIYIIIIIIIIMLYRLYALSLTFSRHFSLSFIASGRSSGLHPVSSHSCCMYVRAGRPAFAQPYVGVHRSTSLMSSSLLLQQCPACQVRRTWLVFVMEGRWLYSWCFVGCCRQDLFNFARNILV